MGLRIVCVSVGVPPTPELLAGPGAPLMAHLKQIAIVYLKMSHALFALGLVVALFALPGAHYIIAGAAAFFSIIVFLVAVEVGVHNEESNHGPDTEEL